MNWNNLWGYTHLILYFSNIMTNKVIIYLTRHGESEYNVLKKIGGNSNLTNKGLHYSKVLYEYFQNDKIDVYTSNLNRTIQTSQYFHETRAYPELNEINSGICDSKTYDEIKSLYPEEYEKRKVNKYCYRYPKGESYEDIKNRVTPFMEEILKSRDNRLIICHQAVLRVLYSFFIKISEQEIPHLEIPLHTLFKFTIFKQDDEIKNVELDKHYFSI
jgi:broad specificity phosphatase PhoE